MIRSRSTLLAMLAVAILVLAACGGGDSNTTTGESSATTSGGSVVTTPEVSVGGGFDGSLEACTELASAFLVVAAGPVMGFVGGADGAAEFEESLADLNVRVPSELADEFAIIEAAFAEFNAVLGGASMSDMMDNPAVAERFEEASAALDDPEVEEALDTMGEFLEDNCSEFGFTDLTP